jgi:hypothetical protein
MGFTSLKNWQSTDTAADTMIAMVEAAFKEMVKGYERDKHNSEYNTPGAINVCLILESGMFSTYVFSKEQISFLKKIREELVSIIEFKAINKSFLKACKRMLKFLDKTLKQK